MRSWRRAVVALALAGCGDVDVALVEDHAPLHFDVVVRGSGVILYVTDPARPQAMDPQPFVHPGQCDQLTDAVSCDEPCPGDWIGALRLVRDGELLGEGVFDAMWGGGVGLGDQSADGTTLIISARDGGDVAIPISAPSRPIPTIDDVVRTTVCVSVDEVALTWSTEPAAASAVVEISGGFGGPRCHQPGNSGVTTMEVASAAAMLDAYVTAFAAPTTADTAFGDAHVWVGALTRLDLLADEPAR